MTYATIKRPGRPSRGAEHICDPDRSTGVGRLVHCLHQSYRAYGLRGVRLWRLPTGQAAGEVFDVVLIFARVMRMAAEAEKVVVGIIECLDHGLLADFQRIPKVVVVGV